MRLESRQYAILLCVSLLVISILKVTGLQSYWNRESTRFQSFMDTQTRGIQDFFSIASRYRQTKETMDHVRSLEGENRALYAKYAAVLQEKKDIEKLASQSALLEHNASLIPVRISKDAGGWYVIADAHLSIAQFSAVYVDGMYVGKISESGNQVAPLMRIEDGKMTLSLQHQKSGKIGTLIYKKGELILDFFEVIPDLAEGDLLTSVPDKVGTPSFIPVGKVGAIRTKPSDSTSQVRVDLLAHIRIGDIALISPSL